MHRAALVLSLCGSCLLAGAQASAQQGTPEPPPEPAAEGASPSEPTRAPHPEPRVIVSVLRLTGAHDKSAVERSARLGWGRIVRCYKTAMADGVLAKGTVEARVTIASDGQVRDARKSGGTIKGELGRCVVRSMRRLTMPRARAGSTAEVVIRVAPGDRLTSR